MPDLSSNERIVLLKLARQAIESRLKSTPEPDPAQALPWGGKPRGCFVTLFREGALRGCVGTFDADHALVENVIRMARAAAFQDTRFSQVTRPEIDKLRIEISVLGPVTPLKNLEELEMGRHGILVQYGARSGTYLPQVAVEQGWSREEFVTRCAREKAGLTPAECASARLSVYTVEKFGEPAL